MAIGQSADGIGIRTADLDRDSDQHAVLRLLNHYAAHPMGQGTALPDGTLQRLIPALQSHPTTLIFLATADEQAVGMAICFVGFSTFKVRQLINIHDLVVHSDHRGKGIGGRLLDAVIDYAGSRDFCAVTLEVKADNPARRLYINKGFRDLSDPITSQTMLFGKLLLDLQ